MPVLEVEAGTPVLMEETEPVAATGTVPSAGGWTPEVMEVLLKGLYGMMASLKGPHWAWNETEGGPLVGPTADVFNMTPVLKDVAPQHVAIVTVVLGHGAMISKRLAWDKQLAEARKAHIEKPAEVAENKRDPKQSGDWIYGENKLGG